MTTLKLDAEGQTVLQDGKPVYVGDDGREFAADVPALQAQISDLNSEAKGHRLAAKAAKTELAAFEGLDADTARKAVATVNNLDAKKLVDAGEIEKLKASLTEGFTRKLEESAAALAARETRIRELTVGNAFRSSSAVTEQLTIPPDMAEEFFGRSFKVTEAGEIVGHYANGQPVMSADNPAKEASFEEAFAAILAAYPNRAAIMRTGPAGSGSGGGAQIPQGKKAGDFSLKEKLAYIERHGPEAWGKHVVASGVTTQ